MRLLQEQAFVSAAFSNLGLRNMSLSHRENGFSSVPPSVGASAVGPDMSGAVGKAPWVESWSFSLYLLVSYVLLFWVWMTFPARSMYLIGGSLVLVPLVRGFRRAADRGYFANSIDSRLHALVLIDVFLETLSFEIFRLFQPLAVAESFHRNTNFIGCATAFALLLGGYRFWALRKRNQRR